MFGFLLVIISGFFIEISDIIAKEKIKTHQISVYATGFLVSIFGIIFFICTGLIWGSFQFSMNSLPTLGLRIILEIILHAIIIMAIAKSNRSTFGFVRTLTIPLLLIANIIMGYGASSKQILGIIIITGIVTTFLYFSGKFEKRGLGLLLISAILPVFTISLYKYNITNFNSVEAEQIIVSIALLIFFLLMAIFKAKENPFKFLLRPVYFFQAMMAGVGGVVGSFAYLFLLPSVVVAITRSCAVLFAVLSGDFYFKEKRPFLKILVALAIILGLVFLV